MAFSNFDELYQFSEFESSLPEIDVSVDALQDNIDFDEARVLDVECEDDLTVYDIMEENEEVTPAILDHVDDMMIMTMLRITMMIRERRRRRRSRRRRTKRRGRKWWIDDDNDDDESGEVTTD